MIPIPAERILLRQFPKWWQGRGRGVGEGGNMYKNAGGLRLPICTNLYSQQ